MKFPKYSLTQKQIRGLANIVLHENSCTTEAMYAEASLMANLTDIYGNDHATVDRLIKTATGGWFAHGKDRYNAGTINKAAIKAVTDVIVKGKRTLPRYVNEHDCLSDIEWVKNNGKKFSVNSRSKYQMHKTVIYNRYCSEYTFYSFPGGFKTGVDPFGYTSDSMREKWGEFHYKLEQAMDDKFKGDPEGYKGTFPALPDKSWGVNRDYFQYGDGISALINYHTQIRRVQLLLKWAGFYKTEIDGKYGRVTEDAVRTCQKHFKLPVNGKFGKKCLAKLKDMRK